MTHSAESDESPLDRLVQVRKRFRRSVHLPQDWGAPHEPADYVTTPSLLDLAKQVLAELGSPRGVRAWTFTGPFGTGKSAFALFLTDLLAGAQPRHPDAGELYRTFLNGSKPLVPLLVQAERRPIIPTILNCLADNPSVADKHRQQARKLLQERGASGESVAGLLVSAAEVSQGGLVLIVDELGKYLEFAARTPSEDVFILQQLAEAAARSEKPFLFIGVLHSGFGEYVSDVGDARRSEWQKVQGRFQDLPFVFPYEQFLDLLGSALCADLGKPHQNRFQRIANGPALQEVCKHRRLRSRLANCLPIHPLAALILWPLFRGKAAQNERSLFAFLTSHEPHGFQDVLARELNLGQQAPLYGLSSLYDYISSSLGLSVFTGRDSRKWGLIESALERVPESAPLIARGLVKAIGLLSMYGDTANVHPNLEILQAAFDDVKSDEIEEALALLEQESIVVFRKHKGAYGLWEGSDLDLDAAFRLARGHCGGEPIHRRILRSGKPRPIVARAHYVKTGTLRHFEVRLTSITENSLESALREQTSADGIVVFVVDVDRSENDADHALKMISSKKCDGKPVLVAMPHSLRLLNESLDELECWEWIGDNVPELDGDSVARNEVQARAMDARIRFERVAGSKFGLPGHVLDPSESAWFGGGVPLHSSSGAPTRPASATLQDLR